MKVKEWDADYDVIVLGFGGAGATAARFAADNGAKVLLVDAAPFGHEGGNTRYSAQQVAMAYNFDKLAKYYHKLAAPFTIPEKTLDTYLHGMVNMPKYFEKYLDVKAFQWSRNVKSGDKLDKKDHMAEYPEYDGSKTFDFALVHNRDFDAALWKLLRKKVLDRKENIDIWLNSKAKDLIQDSEKRAIIGVAIERNHHLYYIHAKNGVVLATGGFENNNQLQQNFLHISHLTPFGTLYNKGAGVIMAAKVGAQLWHMSNYESLGVIPGYTFAEDEGHRGRQIGHWNLLYSGSIFAIANDGTRFMKEDAKFRHGHIYTHGDYVIPHAYDNAWLVMDEVQKEKVEAAEKEGKLRYPNFLKKLVSANNVQELAEKLVVPANKLKMTIAKFNDFANSGNDIEFSRSPENMTAFKPGQLFAIKLAPAILNTQGGPRRNENAEIVDWSNKPIPHLYGAGELGGICINRYQGGGNLAECLIFGKLAGQNAATPKSDTDEVIITKPLPRINDLVDGEKNQNIELGPNQYLGSTEAGIGGKIVVRVTYSDQKIKNVEVLESHETEGIGARAIKELPKTIVENNSTDVDAVSGASTTTRALKEAVNQAIKKADK
ncbi:FAD-dependent oxidoreductase [Lactobacillus jensenii]|uniref:FAD-dependent oxidoreductase n=1 Tax=Lactobacillus jensenii TaxID=109790 RepID=UPI0011973B12|nr:FAD-dependent oxidoreductase [Lactobacillus jensenii]MCW8071902.1 FAD-dependent oxidoreductase [Lactobacillus jensenii]MDK6782547.1 FAD-dependent oxidoreductase [Lactobacillus jensenii]MDK7318981.1 FAD-dependent oxidoreductase [Lactobacillus jensenii]MDK8236046.1 FAD-dependent oxidoreductase [Lactobacillus jensenii]MDT9586621.1 FAD-dependent oxidoreductase [Lactobacillus jensenii]